MSSISAPRFGAIIQDARKEAGLSQQALADQLGVVRNTIFFWESDRRRPEHEYIPRLCEILGLTPNALYSIEEATDDRANTPMEKQILELFRRLNPAGQEAVPPFLHSLIRAQEEAQTEFFRRSFSLFSLSSTRASAGCGTDYSDEGDGYCFLRANPVNRRADLVVRVTGESMLPLYRDGDLVYVDSTQSCSPGDDVVVNTSDGLVIKRLSPDHTLLSLNPDYPYVPSSEDVSFRIAGKVLGVVSPYDHPSPEDTDLLEELYAPDIRLLREGAPRGEE